MESIGKALLIQGCAKNIGTGFSYSIIGILVSTLSNQQLCHRSGPYEHI